MPECDNGEVRLVGGLTNSTGRLEICANGIWGRVCNAFGNWGTDNARLVCRQLGFSEDGKTALTVDTICLFCSLTGAYVVADASVFGESEQNAVVGEVNCVGTEAGLLECSHSSIGRLSCGNLASETVPDIVISCYGKFLYTLTPANTYVLL